MNNQANKKITVLCVEDEEHLLEILEEEIDDVGWECLSATGGNEAIKIIAANPHIDVVISDVNMPEGDGKALLVEIMKIEGKKPKFIFLSGESDFTEEAAQALGAAAVFYKPTDYEMLIEATLKLV